MYEVRITGLVQGVGFRPFVAETAEKNNISGTVKNTSGDVVIHIWTGKEDADRLIKAVCEAPPAGSFIASVTLREMGDEEVQGLSEAEKEPAGKSGFYIVKDSTSSVEPTLFVPADLPICEKCAAELSDPSSRRYRHPFISCAACGVRYSVISDMPYDRENTAMGEFEMCDLCGAEYRRFYDRRHHAQTICCPDCGPKLSYRGFNSKLDKEEVLHGDDALLSAIDVLKNDGILAIKDSGGFHLAANPKSRHAATILRTIKNRYSKPLAVMFPSTEEAEKYAELSDEEVRTLESVSRPIVLALRNSDDLICNEVFGKSPYLGCMLFQNPLQLLLLQEISPLIMTSANNSGDNLIIDDDEMITFLDKASEKCDAKLGVLYHDRRIYSGLDDPVMRILSDGRHQVMRRGRGMVPLPVECRNGTKTRVFDEKEKIFAAGGDLKSSFVYVENSRVYMSGHLGDMANRCSEQAYKKEKKRFETLYGFKPNKIVLDMHPGYILNDFFDEHNKNLIKIQHHKAHVASVIAEHALSGAVLGFAFDGTGFGLSKKGEGEIWGSEVFYIKEAENREQEKYLRVAHLSENKLVLNDNSIKKVDNLLYSYMFLLDDGLKQRLLEYIEKTVFFDKESCDIIWGAMGIGMGTVTTTSMGRLFDAVSALLDIVHETSYEGEAAIELEYLAQNSGMTGYVDRSAELLHVEMTGEGECVMSTDQVFSGILDMLLEGRKKGFIARDFIHAVGRFILYVAKSYPDAAVALSGGTFGNRILTEYVIRELKIKERPVYVNEQVPSGDGGLALGQAYLACS